MFRNTNLRVFPIPPSSLWGMSKVIIIDDSDPDITYQGNWTTAAVVGTMASVGSNTNEYNSTVHISRSAGDKLTFKFEGVSLSVWGTLDRPAIRGPPSINFTVDDLAPVAFNQTFVVIPELPGNAMPHMLLYQTPTLIKGLHTFSITIPSSVEAPFYFDFFTVDVGSDSTAGHVIVDDSDPLLTYNGDWFTLGAQYEYMHTTHGMSATGVGDATFSFYGESITVYGTTARIGTTPISCTIDGVQRNTSASSQGSTLGSHTILFYAEELAEDKQHTLVITPSLPSDTWFIDYIIYKTNDSKSVTIAGPQTPNRPPKLAAIVGGVISGVILVIIIAIGLVCLNRRRKARKPETTDAIALTRRSSADTRSIRSVRSTSGLTNGIATRQSSIGAPVGILRSGTSSASAIERQRIRISEAASTSRVSVRTNALSVQVTPPETPVAHPLSAEGEERASR